MKRLFLFGFLASLFNTSNHQGAPFKTSQKKFTSLSPDEIETKINESRGLLRFQYPGGSVWALNEKNADRKARKQKLI